MKIGSSNMGENLRTGLMFIALVAFLTAFGFCVMSTTTSDWYVDKTHTNVTASPPDNIVNRGLWQWCDYDGVCAEIPDEDYLRAVRGFSILSLIAALVSLVLSLLAVNEDGTKLKLAAALAVFITALFQLIAMAVYTGVVMDDVADFRHSNWGYSFGLGWSAVCLYVIVSIIYVLVATVLQDQPAQVNYTHVKQAAAASGDA